MVAHDSKSPRIISRGFLLLLALGLVNHSDGRKVFGQHFGRAPLLERYAWRVLDWAYPDEASRQQAIANREFIPENGLPVGIEIWRNKLFVSVPRWRDGMCSK